MSFDARLDASWAGEIKMFSFNLLSSYGTISQLLQAMINK